MDKSEGKRIIQEARAFMDGKLHARWSDYLMFEQRLVACKCTQYIALLRDILNV